jgi:hypothetical protein
LHSTAGYLEGSSLFRKLIEERALTPVPVLQRLTRRLEKRMESLQRVKLAGFDVVIAELEVELGYLCRAMRLLED